MSRIATRLSTTVLGSIPQNGGFQEGALSVRVPGHCPRLELPPGLGVLGTKPARHSATISPHDKRLSGRTGCSSVLFTRPFSLCCHPCRGSSSSSSQSSGTRRSSSRHAPSMSLRAYRHSTLRWRYAGLPSAACLLSKNGIGIVSTLLTLCRSPPHFIQVLLSLQQPKSAVFAGTFGALAIMTVISVGLGEILHIADESVKLPLLCASRDSSTPAPRRRCCASTRACSAAHARSALSLSPCRHHVLSPAALSLPAARGCRGMTIWQWHCSSSSA